MFFPRKLDEKASRGYLTGGNTRLFTVYTVQRGYLHVLAVFDLGSVLLLGRVVVKQSTALDVLAKNDALQGRYRTLALFRF